MSIKFQNLSFKFSSDEKEIISDFSARIEKDEITVITGESGCGKSTLLFLASGLYPSVTGIITGGKVLTDEKELQFLTPSERCRTAGVMFQNPDMQFCMDTVRNELVFCLENINTPEENIEALTDTALDFCGISHLKNRLLCSLSGGEKQKVQLSCLYALSPEWLLLDEPFANIDNDSANLITKKLLELHKTRGIGILAVDHHIGHWMGIANKILLMENGKVRTVRPERDELISCGIYPDDIPYDSFSIGQNLGDTALDIRHLFVSYKDKQILKDISLTVRHGEIFALTGQSGCGKSTLLNAIIGMVKHKGSIRFSKGRKTKIGIVTQNPQDQFVSDTVKKEILVSLGKDRHREEKALAILKSISLSRYRDVSPYILSIGQQRRLGSASLCAYRCDVLLCDEPAYAQDRKNAVAVMDNLCTVARKNGTAMIFSTHDIQLAKAYADKIFEIKDGELFEKD